MSDLIKEAIRQEMEDYFQPKYEKLIAEIEILKSENKFIRYPRAGKDGGLGLQEYLSISYDQAYAMWNDKNFPRASRRCGKIHIKGVYSHDLEKFLKEKRR